MAYEPNEETRGPRTRQQALADRLIAPTEAPFSVPSGNTGVSGYGGGIGVPPTTPAAVPAAPDYTTLGKYTSTAYDPAKFDRPWDQRSEKYQIGSILSHFDPNQGITPDVLKALNDANIHGARFSGSGDKLTVDNATGYDRFGKGGTADVIKGLKSGGQASWGAWFVPDETQAATPAGGRPMFAGSTIPTMLQGDAQTNIQQALANIGALSQPNRLQQLIAALSGGA